MRYRPLGRAVTIALWRANNKPPVELVVANFDGQVDYMYGEALYKPEMKEGNPIRLYSLDEITEIFGKLGLRICNSFADFSGKPSSDNDIQLMVYSIRE